MKGIRKIIVLCAVATMFAATTLCTSAAVLDTKWYAANNPDVVAALGNSPEALRKHYETYGRKEARMANSHDMEAQIRKLFDAEEYAALYPDVKAAFGNDAEAMFQHYMAYGLLETRRPSQKVSYEAAVSMKNAVEKALEKAGLSTKPGEAPMVAILEGSAAQNAGTTEAAQAMAAVTAEVEKAVADTVTVANTPAPVYSAPAASSGGQGAQPAPAPEDPGEEVTEVASDEELQNALKEGKKNIQVTADITNTKGITVSSGTVSIDLGGHTVSRADGQVLLVGGSGVLTVKNGTLKCTNEKIPAAFLWETTTDARLTLGAGLTLEAAFRGIQSSGGTIVVDADATVKSGEDAILVGNSKVKSDVTVKGKLIAGDRGIEINGNRDNGDILLIDGATINAEEKNSGLYLAGNASTTIRGASTITGASTGVEIRAGVLTVESGSIEGKGATYSRTASNGGSTVDGVALAISQHCTRHDVTVTVNSGVELKTASDTVVVVTDTLVVDTAASGKVEATISCAIPDGKKVCKGGTNVAVSGVADGSIAGLSGNAISGSDDGENQGNSGSTESSEG